MGLRWKTFDETPDNIQTRYYFRFGDLPTPRLALVHPFSPGDLDLAATIYWDRNIPILVCTDLKPMIRAPSRRRYYQPLGIRDKCNRWFPLPLEVQDCCKKLTGMPPYQLPWTWQVHCNTVRHVALLAGVDPKQLQERINEDLGVLAPIPILPKRCKNCGKF